MSQSLKKNRARAFDLQKGRCFYCGFLMWLQDPAELPLSAVISPRALKRFMCTAEHKIAKADGGSNTSENIVAACRFCNQQRHRRKKPLNSEAYKRLVQARVRRRKWHHAWAYLTG